MNAAALEDHIGLAAERLAGGPLLRCERVGGGRNARVFRIETRAGLFALKQYPAHTADSRDRLGAERDALRWIEDAGISAVPRFIAADEVFNFALLSWVDGALPAEIRPADIDQATDFLEALQAANTRKRYPAPRLASEACLSGAEIERQLRIRLDGLRALSDEPDLNAFLDNEFAPALERHLNAARRLPDFAVILPPERRRPVPADFGFHNSLRDRAGRLTFVDFEYFGWDDPAKLACDFLLHPGTSLSQDLRAKLSARLLTAHADDPAFKSRIDAYLPLFALRWVLILLNEYRPERWRQRVAAGETEDWAAAKTRQLDRARAMLQSHTHTGNTSVPSPTVAVRQEASPLDARSKYLRKLAVRALDKGGRGHIGSTMSLIEIMRVLYDDVLRYRAGDPAWAGRDRMILSKGHGCLAQYVMLADKGFFPLETLDTFCHRDSILGGHPESNKIPGVEASTGALGHGLSIGTGMALAARVRKQSHRVIVVMGDGEIDEGSVWEAAMAAGKHRLSNLTAVIDYNKIQSAGFTRDIQDLEPLADKWRAFGFSTIDVDGHDVSALREAFASCPRDKDRPTAMICHTVKGKGIPFAEWDPAWHHKSKLPAAEIARLYESLE